MRAPPLFLALFACACGARTELGTVVVERADASVAICKDEIIATDVDGATALANDGDTIFWGTNGGQIQMHDSAGTTLLSSVGDPISSIAVDATTVYFLTTGVLHTVPRAGGATTQLARGLGQSFALSVMTESRTSSTVHRQAGAKARAWYFAWPRTVTSPSCWADSRSLRAYVSTL